MLCAVLAGLAVYVEILTPVLVKGANICVIMVLIGFVAGASERFAPSIISRVEASAQGEPKNSSSGRTPTSSSSGGEENEKKGTDHNQSG